MTSPSFNNTLVIDPSFSVLLNFDGAGGAQVGSESGEQISGGFDVLKAVAITAGCAWFLGTTAVGGYFYWDRKKLVQRLKATAK